LVTFSDIQRNRADFFVVQEQGEIDDAWILEAQIANGKDQMRNRGGVADTPDIKAAADGLHVHLAVKVAGFNAESMGGEFPEIKTYANYYRKLGMDTGEIAGNDGIKSSYNGKFAAVFLSKITKGKKFYFHLVNRSKKSLLGQQKISHKDHKGREEHEEEFRGFCSLSYRDFLRSACLQ